MQKEGKNLPVSARLSNESESLFFPLTYNLDFQLLESYQKSVPTGTSS